MFYKNVLVENAIGNNTFLFVIGENRNSHAPQNDSANSIAAFADQIKTIFLQTARADYLTLKPKVLSKPKFFWHSDSMPIRKVIRTEKISIKIFGQINDFKLQVSDVVQLITKH